MKKLLCLVCSMLIFSMTFCFGGCGVIKYSQYPTLEWVSSEGNTEGYYIYNGKRYYPTDKIGVDDKGDEYCINHHDWELVASRWWLNSMKTPVYVNELDKDENVLYMPAVYAADVYFVEENFRFPDVYNTEISNIFLATGAMDWAAKNEVRNYLQYSWDGITYNDLVEEEIIYIERESGTWGGWYRVYLELTNYEYFKSVGVSVAEVDNELYMLVNQRKCVERENSSTIFGFDCQKIKPEYYEVFRNAMDQLDSMQAQ